MKEARAAGNSGI